MYTLAAFVILSLISYINCTSSGQFITACDALSDVYGCTPEKWIDGNRKECNESGKIMAWVSRGVESSDYSLSFGPYEDSPVSQYSPDEIIPIHIRTHVHGMKWRGIMMYAIDSENNRVGSWEIPEESTIYFQVAGEPCDSTVLHNSAVRKPYHLAVNWKAPSTAVGDVTFHCLLKEGNANTGAFYYPAGTLSGSLKLTQHSNPIQALPWVRSELGQNCNEACATVGTGCNLQKMNEISTPELFTQHIASMNLCKLPLLSGCNELGVTSSADRLCYYASTSEHCGQQNRAYQETTCEARSDNPAFGQRWCYCQGEMITTPTFSQSKTVTEIQTTLDSEGNTVSQTVVVSKSQTVDGTPCTLNSDCESGVCKSEGTCFVDAQNNSGSNLKTQLFTFIVLGFGFFNFGYSRTLVFVMISLILVSGTSAHNWIASTARAAGTASTVLPCPAKLSEKPHIQVGQDQLFQIQWMTGHINTITQFVVLHQSHEDKLGLHTEKYLLDYINEAPTGSNLAQNPAWAKRHRTPLVEDLNSGILKSEITVGSQHYLDVPDVFPVKTDQKLYDYNSQYLEEDHYYEYENPQFPWMESVYKYVHSIDQPNEWDVTNFKIPGLSGFGRYIVHYVWRGYRDCIEVDFLDHIVDFPYGISSGADTWNVIPHCFYDKFEQTRSRCNEALPSLYHNTNRCGSQTYDECRGINIVPYKYPDSVYSGFQDFDHIPWQNSWCNGSMATDWVELSTEEQKETMYVSYAVRPRIATSTEWYFTTSEDPQDPIFYSTCLNREEARTFEGYDDDEPTVLEHPWRFIDQCISCENRQKNAESVWPKFDIADTCVNCDVEPIPKFPHFTFYANNSYCRNLFDNCEPEIESCTKRVMTYTEKYPRVKYEDCSFLVQRDPECSDYFWANGDGSCNCLKNYDCCMDSGCELYDDNNNGHKVLKNTFVVDTPDPECDRGVEFHGNCCSLDENDGSLDFCCKDCLDWRPCESFGPPCKLV